MLLFVALLSILLAIIMIITKRNVLYIGPGFSVMPTKNEAPRLYWITIVKAFVVAALIIFDYLFGIW